MREEKITVPQHRGLNVEDAPCDNGNELATQILDALEQGVILWSGTGTCLKHNRRIFDVLEWHPLDLQPGVSINDLFEQSQSRGDTANPSFDDLIDLFTAGGVFHFEQTLQSGRIISASARPVRGGGHVVAYSDVTETRATLQALHDAQIEADAAEQKAVEILTSE